MSSTRAKIFATLPLTNRGTPVHLGVDPKGKNFLYTNGRSVIIRDLANPGQVDQYTEHICNVNVARYAPSGFYIASGDAQGNVRIWDTTQLEHPLKLEIKVIANEIKDIAWDSESKRVIAVGNGLEKYGHAFMFDSGSSVGEISGHSKTVNSVDIKPTRPYRAVTVSDDMQVNYFEGPPFKYKQSNKDHTRFVNCVRFNSTGTHYATAGADMKILLFDAKTGEKVGELAGPEGHTGSVFSLCWSPDGNSLMSCSADRTVKIWDLATQKCTTTYKFGSGVDDQQVGCLWSGDHLVSLSLSGDLNYLDPANPEKPKQILTGHSKPIMSLVVKDRTLYTGDTSGRICAWNFDDSTCKLIAGQGHTNQVSNLLIQNDQLVSAGLDDTVRYVSLATGSFTDSVKAEAQPRALAVSPVPKSSVVVLATIGALVVIKGGKAVHTTPVRYTIYSAAISRDGTELAVGSDDTIHLYTINANDTLSPKKELTGASRGQISALAYSPDGKWLAAGDSARQVILHDTSNWTNRGLDWCFHQARITSLAWSPNSLQIASGSIDTHAFIWYVDRPSKKLQIKNAHVLQVNGVDWIDDNTLITVGQDCCAKAWTLTHPQ